MSLQSTLFIVIYEVRPNSTLKTHVAASSTWRYLEISDVSRSPRDTPCRRTAHCTKMNLAPFSFRRPYSKPFRNTASSSSM